MRGHENGQAKSNVLLVHGRVGFLNYELLGRNLMKSAEGLGIAVLLSLVCQGVARDFPDSERRACSESAY